MRSLLPIALVLLVACGDAGAAPDGPTLDAFGSNFVATQVAEADNAGLDDDEASCIATAIYVAIGEARLVELGIAEDGTGGGLLGGGSRFSDQEQSLITRAFDTCLDDPLAWLLPVRTADDQCMLDYMRSTDVTLEQLLFAEEPDNEEAVGRALVDAAGACLG